MYANFWARLYLQVMVWMGPTEWGWDVQGDKLIPLVMQESPAPGILLKMIQRNCTTGCSCTKKHMALNDPELADLAKKTTAAMWLLSQFQMMKMKTKYSRKVRWNTCSTDRNQFVEGRMCHSFGISECFSQFWGFFLSIVHLFIFNNAIFRPFLVVHFWQLLICCSVDLIKQNKIP